MDNRAPTISIVIPCYNYAAYVGTTIASALAQDYPHTEVLVINDGSTDNSIDVIKRYADRVRVLDQPNQGHIACYNQGLEETQGEIVIFLDADDRLEPGALTKIARAWSPACAKVQYDLRIIDAHGEDLGRRFCNFTPGYDAARVRAAFQRTGTYRWPVFCGNAYSRWFLEAVFPLRVRNGPDGLLNTVAPVYGTVEVIPEPLAAYRLHGANNWSTSGNDWDRLPRRISLRRREVDFMRRHAAERGVRVPAGDVLDHELAFINFRLMAFRLGVDYEGKDTDSPTRLWRRGCAVARAERLPGRLTAAHWLWFSALLLAPDPLARRLVSLRFGRAALAKSAKRRVVGARDAVRTRLLGHANE